MTEAVHLLSSVHTNDYFHNQRLKFYDENESLKWRWKLLCATPLYSDTPRIKISSTIWPEIQMIFQTITCRGITHSSFSPLFQWFIFVKKFQLLIVNNLYNIAHHFVLIIIIPYKKPTLRRYLSLQLSDYFPHLQLKCIMACSLDKNMDYRHGRVLSNKTSSC